MNKTLQNGINSVRFSELLKLFREVKSTSAGRLFQVRIVLQLRQLKRAKVTIGSLQEVVYEKSINTKMNDLDLCLEVMSTIALHSTLNISETVRDRGLVPKDDQQEMDCGKSNCHVTDDVA